jgi:RNA polymerase sigma factor (TIGR02999 family)
MIILTDPKLDPATPIDLGSPMEKAPITLLLDAARSGDDAATESLFNAVYTELKIIARSNRRRWRGNQTMNTTALIHEVFIRLAGSDNSNFANRTHFFATASKAMRQVLVNYARKQKASKRGGDALVVTLDETIFATETSAEELLELHQLLADLEADNKRRAQIVECRVFGGMTVQEVAEALSISTATVKREWKIGTASLYKKMHMDFVE